MFIYKVVSVLISSSVLSKPQSLSQSFASQILTDSGGRTFSKSIYTDSSGKLLLDGSAPELLIGLVPPFSGDSNDIDNIEPEPIVIIKPPPYMKKTTSYPTAFTTTRTTPRTQLTSRAAPTRAPLTTQRLTTVRTTTPRTTVIAKTFSVKPPTQFVPRVSASSFKSSGEEGKYRSNFDGSYRPKGNTGAYTHNSAGAYRHSNSGAYKPDDRGKYRGN